MISFQRNCSFTFKKLNIFLDKILPEDISILQHIFHMVTGSLKYNFHCVYLFNEACSIKITLYIFVNLSAQLLHYHLTQQFPNLLQLF